MFPREITDINIHLSTKENANCISSAFFIRIKENDGLSTYERIQKAIAALNQILIEHESNTGK